MSSCCGESCGCGPDCSCGSGCKGCKMYPDMSYAKETTTSKTPIVGSASQKSNFEGSGLGMGAESIGMGAESIENGCKCNPCNCNPCNCK